jgi:DNA polymerase I-like protein with 3'-5' exonuclease and polymerase domains
MADYQKRARDRFALYGAEDAIFTLHLNHILQGLLRPDQAELVALETRVCHPVVTEMEERGMPVDMVLLSAIRDRMLEASAQLHEQVVAEWGTANGIADFNPGSDDQKAHVIWEVWGCRPPRWALDRGSGGGLKPQWARKKDGLCKTGKEVLAALISKGGPHAEKLGRMVELSRIDSLLSNPVKPIEQAALMDPDNRLHYSFWPVGTETGRFASSPNAQNIPRTSSMPYVFIPKGADPTNPPRGCTVVVGKDKAIDTKRWQIASLRDVFAARAGWMIVSADLSQIENRVVAYESNDATLLGIYRHWDCADCGASGEVQTAIHACPACNAPEGKRDKTLPDQPAIKGFCLGKDIHAHSSVAVGFYDRWGYAQGRQAAKALNHAAAYGMGANTMARYYDMEKKVCREALESWHARHPGVHRMHERVAREIWANGLVKMCSGHERRFLSEKLIHDSGNLDDWAAEKVIREGVNSLAQGAVAAFMKQAMTETRDIIVDTPHLRGNAHAVNQMHDETVYEVKEEYAEEVLALVCDRMEHNHLAERVPVPVIAEGAIGRTWGEAH